MYTKRVKGSKCKWERMKKRFLIFINLGIKFLKIIWDTMEKIKIECCDERGNKIFW
jgi:hypothetical protein